MLYLVEWPIGHDVVYDVGGANRAEGTACGYIGGLRVEGPGGAVKVEIEGYLGCL